VGIKKGEKEMNELPKFVDNILINTSKNI